MDGLSNFVISIKNFLPKNKIRKNLNPDPVEYKQPPKKVSIIKKLTNKEFGDKDKGSPDVDTEVVIIKNISWKLLMVGKIKIIKKEITKIKTII